MNELIKPSISETKPRALHGVMGALLGLCIELSTLPKPVLCTQEWQWCRWREELRDFLLH